MEKRDENGLTKHDRYRLKDIESYRRRKKEWAKTPEQRKIRNEYMRIWREKNREKHNQQAKESHHRNKWKHIGKSRNNFLKHTYGITEEDYNKMFVEQNGVCKICGNTPHEHGKSKMSRVLHIDHDHSTSKIRGLLCSRCNGALGWFEKYRNPILKYLGDNISLN